MVLPAGFHPPTSAAPHHDVLFYLVATVRGALCPLAVVSQIPPADDCWMFLTKHFLIGKAARVHAFLASPAHRCALEAELGAARHLYTARADDARQPPGLMRAEDREEYLRDPLLSVFPYATHALLDCVAGGETECGATPPTATRFWSPLRLDTSFEYGSYEHDAIVFDVTDLDDIRYAVLAAVCAPPGHPSWHRAQGLFNMHHYASLGIVYIGGATPIPIAAVKRFENLGCIDAELIYQLFWGPRAKNRQHKAPSSRMSLADVAIRNLVLAAGDREAFDVDAGALEECRDTMPHFAGSLRRILLQHAKADFKPQALGRLMSLAYAGAEHLALYDAGYVHCDALSVALCHESMRRVTTLSIATDALHDGDLAVLARALHGLPELTTVYVGDFRGEPTEGSRREAARLQRRLNRAVKDLGGLPMRNKMFYSSGYASCLAGQLICHQRSYALGSATFK